MCTGNRNSDSFNNETGVGKSVNAVAQSRGRGAPTTKTLNLNISGSKKHRD